MLIANHTREEYITTIRRVMKIAHYNKLWLNENTCQFMPASMQILSNICTDQGLEAEPDKIDTILKFSKWEKQRQLQR